MSKPPVQLLLHALSPESARNRIEAFVDRFDPAHLLLAYHAAFPLSFTPDLLYALRYHFRRDTSENQLDIPWFAVADLLLSPLCEEVGYELYAMNVTVRKLLLQDLTEDRRFGSARLRELAAFLIDYVEHHLATSDNPDEQVFAETQLWTAQAYIEPRAVASKLAEALKFSIEQSDKMEQVRLASLSETFAEPLKEYAPLLSYTRKMAHLVYGTKRTLIEGKADVASIKRLLDVELPPLEEPEVPQRERQVATSAVATEVFQSSNAAETLRQQRRPPFSPIPAKRLSPVKLPPINTKCICPSCFEEIYIGDCAIVSGVIAGKVLKAAPTGWLERQIARRNPEHLDGPLYTRELAHRECWNCKYELPHNIERVNNIMLAIVGDVASGKSHYVTSLIHQMKTEWATNQYASSFFRIACQTPEVERRFDRALFERRQVLPNMMPAISQLAAPLIYTITMAGTSRVPAKEWNLFIYNTASEDYLRPERLVEFARPMLYAHAFIFVVDPLAINQIFNNLPVTLQDNMRQFNSFRGRPADSFNHIMKVYERFRGVTPASGLPHLPVAIMLSKSDLLKQIGLPDNYAFMSNPAYGTTLDVEDLSVVDQEVRYLLRENRQNDLLALASTLKRAHFFASSATGEPPELEGYYRHVQPCRCLDPLLWILYQFGIIDAKR